MTRKQEIFDTVVDHLRKQNCKSRRFGGLCLYLAEDGRKCAIGCLIPENRYKKDMEGCDAYTVIKSFELEDVLPRDCWPMLFELQNLHDHLEVDEWEDGFIDIAKKENLVIKEKE